MRNAKNYCFCNMLVEKLQKSCFRFCFFSCFFFMNFRSTCPEMFCKKGVFRHFANFTGKHLCQNLYFNKVAGPPAALLKKRLWHRCFPVNFFEISKNTLHYRTHLVAASGIYKLVISSFFSMNFQKQHFQYFFII